MGTRINVLLDHDLADYQDRDAVLVRLGTALPAALAVRDYWQSADPQGPREKLAHWRAEAVSPHDTRMHRYTGPGRSLFVTVTKQAAHIRTGGRRRDFLSISPLRRVHMVAFRQIAGAVGASCMAIYADSCEVDDLFWDGLTRASPATQSR